MPVRIGGTAPYAPPATVLQAINAFRERGLSTPITVDVLTRASIPETLAGRTLRSLEGLDLLDKNGKPTDEFEGLRRVPSSEFKSRLEAIVRSVYAEVFQFTDPATDDAAKVADAFRAFEPIGQRGRMVVLFLGLCAAAGIIPEGQKKAKAPLGNGKKRIQTPFRVPRVTDGPSVSSKANIRNDSGGLVPPALMGLLASIPADGAGWTTEQRKRFLAAFESVLDFTIPVVADVTPNDDDDE